MAPNPEANSMRERSHAARRDYAELSFYLPKRGFFAILSAGVSNPHYACSHQQIIGRFPMTKVVLSAMGAALAMAMLATPAQAFWGSWGGGPWYGSPWYGGPWYGGYPGYGYGYPGYGYGYGYPGYGYGYPGYGYGYPYMGGWGYPWGYGGYPYAAPTTPKAPEASAER
jgi:hypothetical protein